MPKHRDPSPLTHHVEMTPERIAAVTSTRTQGMAALEVMERHLGKRRFFAGERYTIADISLYAYQPVVKVAI